MAGQGRPWFPDNRPFFRGPWRAAPFGWQAAWSMVVWLYVGAGVLAASDELELQLRLLWGGGAARQWQGQISVNQGRITLSRDLGVDPQRRSFKLSQTDLIQIRPAGLVNYDGCDMVVRGPATATLGVQLAAADLPEAAVSVEVVLADLVNKTESRSLDGSGNRLILRRTPGDWLRIRTDRTHLIFTPGELFRFEVVPHLLRLEPDGSYRVRVWLTAAGETTELWSWQSNVRADEAGELSSFRPADMSMPSLDGVYRVSIAVLKRSRIEVPVWRSTPVYERHFQVVVLSDQPPATDSTVWRELTTLDPANPPWRSWAAHLPGLSLLPRWETARPVGSEEPRPMLVGEQVMLQLAPGAWQAYPLAVGSPGTPHILEVDYPAHLPQALGVSVLEPNALGQVVPLSIDGGIFVPRQVTTGPESIEKYRLVFWPKTKAPIVLFTNHRQDGPAFYGAIRLYSGPTTLPASYAKPLAAQGEERLAAVYFDRPLFSDNFSAEPLWDGQQRQLYDDWWKFYHGALRLAQYVKYAGYNGAVITVARDGGLLYPSRFWAATPKYDTGILNDLAPDPVPKDVLELLLRVFDREGLRLIPAIHFSGRVSTLDALYQNDGQKTDGIVLRDVRGRTSRARYNPLDDRVQQLVIQVVDELAARCSGHSSYQGIAIVLAPDTFVTLPDAGWGFDQRTWNRFLRSLRTEESSQLDTRPEQLFRNQQLTSKWLAWRAEELARLFSRCSETVRTHHSTARLWLATGEWLEGRTTQRMLQPVLSTQANVPIREAALQTGIDPAFYQQIPGLTLLRPYRARMSFDLPEQAVDLQLLLSDEVNTFFQTHIGSGSHRGAVIYHDRNVSRWPHFDSVSPFGPEKTRTELYTHAPPAGAIHRRRWIQALAHSDPETVFEGGWLLPLGQEDQLRSLLDVYRSLPVARFAPVRPRSDRGTQPVLVRSLRRGDRLYYYILNNSPWPISLRMTLDGPADMKLHSFGQRTFPPLQWGEGKWQWLLTMEPYDLVGGWLSSPRAEITDWQVTLPDGVIKELNDKVREVTVRADAALTRPPLPLLANADFEAPAAGEEIPGWRHKQGDGLSVTLDTDAATGRYCLRLKSEGDELWVRSHPFPPPRTGRLYVLARIKTRAGSQPQLRVALDDDNDFYYPLLVGGTSVVRIPDAWGDSFLFPFENLPLSQLENIHLGFDLIGPGEVWVDDIQIFDMWIRREERSALVIAAGMAHKHLERSSNVTDCLHFLESFWPQLLLHYGSLPATHGADGPAVHTAQNAQKDGQAAEKRSPELPRSPWEQVKEWVPRVPLKVPFRN